MLNLYNQEIFDVDTLVQQAQLFIGKDKALFDDFKDILGWYPKVGFTMELPSTSSTILKKPFLYHCKPVKDSPSYRKVPKEVR